MCCSSACDARVAAGHHLGGVRLSQAISVKIISFRLRPSKSGRPIRENQWPTFLPMSSSVLGTYSDAG